MFRYRVHLIKNLIKYWWIDRLIKPTTTISKTLLIVRLDAIGDYILFRNYLQVLRNSKQFHDWHITLCGNIAWKEIAEFFDVDFVDEFIWVDILKFCADITYRKTISTDVANRGYEVALQPTYSRRLIHGDAIIKASGSPVRIGSKGDTTNDWWLLKLFGDKKYTKLIDVSENILFEFERNREFFSNLLGTNIDTNLSLKIDGQKENYVLLFPGASEASRRWPAKYFAEVAIFLRSHGKRIVIAGGPTDRITASEIIGITGNDEIADITGKTSLVELCRYIACAELVVTNLSSAIHIAAASGTTAICPFIDYQPYRFAPYPKKNAQNIHFLAPAKLMNKWGKGDHLIENYILFMSQIDLSELMPNDVIQKVTECLQ